MRFGVPSRPHPVVAVSVLREQADAKPDEEKEQARKRLEDLERRALLIADYEGADQAIHPRRRATD